MTRSVNRRGVVKPRRAAALRLERVVVVADAPRALGAVRGPDEAARLLRAVLPTDREGFAVIHLNARHVATSVEIVSIGSLNASIVHPREVFKGALLANACAIILGHNHPSDDPEPSEEDLSITKRLVEVGDLLGIGVLDHVIITRDAATSFRARQLI